MDKQEDEALDLVGDFLQEISLTPADEKSERKEVKARRSWTPGFREQVDLGVTTFELGTDATERKVSVHIEYRANGTGSSVWDAAVALAKYIEVSGIASGKCCLELGSGTGFLALFAAALGAKTVILTDLEACLPLLERNAKHSFCSDTRVLALPWGHQLPDEIPQDLDLILCADCLLPYATHLFQPLHDTILALLLRHPKSVLLLAYEERMDCSEFFSLFYHHHNVHFSIHPIPPDQQHSYFSDPTRIHIIRCSLNRKDC